MVKINKLIAKFSHKHRRRKITRRKITIVRVIKRRSKKRTGKKPTQADQVKALKILTKWIGTH